MDCCQMEVKVGTFPFDVKGGWHMPCQALAGHGCFQGGL